MSDKGKELYEELKKKEISCRFVETQHSFHTEWMEPKRKEFEGIEMIAQRIDEGIENGETMQTVEVAIMALLSKNGVQASLESPGDINSGNSSTMSGEELNVNNDEQARW